MKRLLAIFVTVLFLLTFVGCQSTENSEMQMKKAYVAQFCSKDSNITPDRLTIESYGTYDGCTVAYIHGPFGYLGWLEDERVGPFVFKYPSSQKLEAYKDGEYKSMPDAYAAGWLDDEAVKQILEKHKQNFDYMYGN